MNNNDTLGILDIFEFRRAIDNSLVPGIRENTYFITAQGELAMRNKCGYNSYGKVKYEYYPIGTNKPGKYPKCSVRLTDGTKKTLSTHKIIAQAYLPLPEGTDYSKMGIKFKDGDKNNLRASNMEWVTRDEQLQESRDARDMDGEKSPTAVFTDAEVHLICKMLQDGFQFAPILKYIGKPVTNSNISQLSKIKNHITWKHISKDYNFPNKR